MRTILTLIAVASISSCAPYGVGEVEYVFDHTESFRDATVAAALIAGSVATAGVEKAREVTSQKANTNATNLGIVNSNNKTAEVLGGQKTTVDLAKIPKQ